VNYDDGIKFNMSIEGSGEDEKNKMLSGRFYDGMHPLLLGERARVKGALRIFNSESDNTERMNIIRPHFGSIGEGCYIEPPFSCDYGYNIKVSMQAAELEKI
jgi:maltose O-acetyltransferase